MNKKDCEWLKVLLERGLAYEDKIQLCQNLRRPETEAYWRAKLKANCDELDILASR